MVFFGGNEVITQKFEASMTNHHGNYFSNILILDILNILSAICYILLNGIISY